MSVEATKPAKQSLSIQRKFLSRSGTSDSRSNTKKLLRLAGVIGLIAAGSMLLWFVIGLAGIVPSIIDTFGIPGLRFPAGIAIAGLLAASIGFHDY